MERPLFCKRELERFAKAFASLVLGKPSASPHDVTIMTSTKDWKKANPSRRQEVAQTVKEQARGLLIDAGYRVEIVHKYIPL